MDREGLRTTTIQKLQLGHHLQVQSSDDNVHETGPRDDDNEHDQRGRGHGIEDGRCIQGDCAARVARWPGKLGDVAP